MSCIVCGWQRLFGVWTARFLILFILLLVGTTGPAQTPPPAATLLWKFDFGNPGPSLGLLSTVRILSSSSTPAVGEDGTLYVGSFNGTLFAITPDGKEKWQFKAGLEIHCSPAVADDGTIYFGSRDRMFYSLNPDGSLKWKFATGAWVDSSPAIAADGTIYFGSWDKNFYALKPDGSLKWKFNANGIVDSSPAIASNGIIYFGSHDKYLYALNPDGTVRWKYLTAGEIASSPAIGEDGMIYFTSMDGNLYALNEDGSLRWKFHSGSTTLSSPVLDSEGSIAIGNTNHTDVISKSGHLRWIQFSPVRIDVTAAAVSGCFYCSAPWRSLEALETGDHPLWKANMDHNATSSVTVGKDGTVYVCADLALYAFRPPDQSLPAAEDPWPMFRANARHTGRVGR